MIKSIELENFRSYKKTKVEFSPHVNMITGNNRVGKTNILRALNWVVTNRPSNFSFHSRFTKDPHTKVTIVTDTDTISLRKTKTEAVYILNGREFKGFGRSVPEEIQRALNLNEINIQSQLDEPFLITSPTSQISKAINRVTEIDKADVWVSKLTSSINAMNRTVERLKSEEGKLEEKIKRLRGVGQLEDRVEDAKDLMYGIEDAKDVWEKFRETWGAKRRYKDLSVVSKKIRACEELIDRISELVWKAQVVGEYLDSEDERREFKKLRKRIGRRIVRSEKLLETIGILNRKLGLVTRANELYLKGIEVRHTVKITKAVYLKKLKEVGRCPICFGKITDACLKRVKGAL